MGNLPRHRWRIASPAPEQVEQLQSAVAGDLHPYLAQVLVNRGINSSAAATAFLQPNTVVLPDPRGEFPDLEASVGRLAAAVRNGDRVAICGDYDADGMTSTALLLRTLRHLGGTADYAIPSRMTEGYGINERMVRDLHAAGVAVLVTVDNGIAAIEPIALARQLGLSVIVTDHHDLPPQLPPADAILNPKLLQPESPYRGMAGVGVAYLLALSLAEEFQRQSDVAQPLLELLTLGTIADLAPLTGINRYWVKAGLELLPRSQLAGVQALMQVTGLSQQRQALPPEAIGFGLGPRINAVGRLAQPAVVIDLLTTEDAGLALERAMQCEQLNQQRRELCRCIELEAIAQVEASNVDLAGDRVLAVLGEGWHHGVIGIVASRLLERYGVPVFIGAVEGNDIRGSARGIPEFDVFQALQACAEVFHKFGGHTAAGGFSMAASQWPNLCEGLRAFAGGVLQPEHLRPALAIDVEAGLPALDLDFFERMQQLQPFGVGNREPVFWSRNLRVSNCRQIGKDRDHLKFQVLPPDSQRPRQAIAWRGGDWSPLPERVDVAYCLRKQDWRGEVAIELEVKGIRATVPDPIVLSATKTPAPSVQLHYRAAPPVPYALQWQSCDSLSDCLEACNGTVLIYGFERPHLKASNGAIHYDRPQPEQVYDALVLWSLPPSLTHLRWLLAAATPARPSGHCIYLHSQSVPLPTASNLQQQLTDHLHCGDRVDLLRLGQQWWVAPSTLVAGLRSLGIPCATFGPTGELAEELAKLERWFCRSVTDVAAIVERCS